VSPAPQGKKAGQAALSILASCSS